MAKASRIFRATGHAPKAVAELGDDGEWVKTTEPKRRKDDFNATPPEAPRAFLKAELKRLRELGGEVWEASAGDGALVREMEAVGLTVFASDLVDRGFPLVVRNYYDFDDWPNFPALPHDPPHLMSRPPPKRVTVQNPPFIETSADPRAAAGRWIKHTRDTLRADYAAFLLPLSWMGPAGQKSLWDLDPPARVYVMRWKIDFTGEGAPPTYHAWYVFDGVTKLGETRLLMLDKGADARQTEML